MGGWGRRASITMEITNAKQRSNLCQYKTLQRVIWSVKRKKKKKKLSKLNPDLSPRKHFYSDSQALNLISFFKTVTPLNSPKTLNLQRPKKKDNRNSKTHSCKPNTTAPPTGYSCDCSRMISITFKNTIQPKRVLGEYQWDGLMVATKETTNIFCPLRSPQK